MTIQKTALFPSILLVAGLATSVYAQAEGKKDANTGMMSVTVIDGDAVTIECIPQAEVDAMTAEDKEKLKLPVCEDAEASQGEKNAQDAKAAQ